MKKARAQVKKEEDARRLAQDFAHKKEEETKAMKLEIQSM